MIYNHSRGPSGTQSLRGHLCRLSLLLALASLTSAAAALSRDDFAASAGITIPHTPLANKAEAYVRSAEPPFLFNHSLRTYLFGAMRMEALGRSFDPETAYVAALFHDFGLLPAAASAQASFEVDGANAAEKFVKENGGSEQQARTVWNAIVMHDMGRSYAMHQSNEALLVAAGAGADVDGVDPKLVDSATLGRVLQAVPRLRFKDQFTALATDHCRRKPQSQIGWLSLLCREVAPVADEGSVREEIASAPFSE